MLSQHREAEQRVTFNRGHFVMLNDELKSIARLEQIFTHETATGIRAFVRIRSTAPRVGQSLDPVTALPIRLLNVHDDDATATQICGLPALSSKRLYILPIAFAQDGTCTLDTDGRDLLHVNWDIQFL